MSASTATTPARPALDANGSFESRRGWVDEDGSPNGRILADVVQRIVRAVDPDRIVLFGSGARGMMKAGSDLDLLIVKAGCNSRELAARAQCSLSAEGPPVDVIAATPEHAERHKDSLSLVLAPALRDGITVYDRTTAVEISDAVRRGSAANRCARAADMMQNRLYKPEEALDWLRKARSELAQSRNPDPEVELDSRCINLPAAAERALKGIITAHGVAVEFTHKLGTLAEQAQRAGENLPPLDRQKLHLLSDHGGEAQYPGWGGETTEQDFQDVRQIAVTIVQHAERRIPEILQQRRSMSAAPSTTCR